MYKLLLKSICCNLKKNPGGIRFFFAFMTEENALNEKKSRQKEILIRQHMAVNVLNIV